jgi:imidazolonepropionase-like amidohydrolase
VNCAKYYEQDGEWGVLKPGAAAEFVMVQKNPLEDLTTLENPQAIMIRGEFIQRDELQLQINLIRQKYVRK